LYPNLPKVPFPKRKCGHSVLGMVSPNYCVRFHLEKSLTLKKIIGADSECDGNIVGGQRDNQT